MAVITASNNGSLKEIMDQSLIDLRAEAKYITAKIGNGSSLNLIMANNRGFRVALDYTRNNTLGYMDPAGGNLTTTLAPGLDNMTANLQYIQFGQEITNLQLANSAAGMHVGPTAKALAARKLLQRRAEMEEYYFCRGNGFQDLGVLTTGQSTTAMTDGGTRALTVGGTSDGLGAYLLGTGQPVRIYASDRTTLKVTGTIASKSSNTACVLNTTTVANSGVTQLAVGDIIMPQSDSITPTTAGVKGLPYLVKASGSYFDKTLSTTTALQAVVDSTTTTFTRTAMEALYRNSQVRCGKNPNQRNVCSLAQLSNYYVQFYAQNTAQVHVVGGERPRVDVGAAGSMDDYTFWGQPIDAYPFIHPQNWWMLDYTTFDRLTLKQAGAMLIPAGQFVTKISSGAYANAQQSWDDDYLEYLSTQPFKNAGFTALSFSNLPGLLVNSPYTGS